jgi:hypothetical protein
MRHVITLISFATAMALNLNAYAADGCGGFSRKGFVTHMETSPGGDRARFSFGIKDTDEGVQYKFNTEPGYGLDTGTGRAMFDALQNAAEHDEQVVVWCAPDGKVNNLWIDYDQDGE